MERSKRPDVIEITITLVKKEGGGDSQAYTERVLWQDIEWCVIRYCLNELPGPVSMRFYDNGRRERSEPTWRMREVPPEGFQCLARGEYYDTEVWKVADVSDELRQLQVCFSETWVAFNTCGHWTFYLSSDNDLREFYMPKEVHVSENGDIFVRTIGRTDEYFPFGKAPWPWPLFNAKTEAFRTLIALLTPDEENPLTMLVRAKDQPYRGEGRRLARSLHTLMHSMLTHEVGALKFGKSKDGREQEAEEHDARRQQRYIDAVSSASS